MLEEQRLRKFIEELKKFKNLPKDSLYGFPCVFDNIEDQILKEEAISHYYNTGSSIRYRSIFWT
jgi:hypothetical protein